MQERKRPQLLTVTDHAVSKLKHLLTVRGKDSLGIRIGTRTRGCSGHTYTLEYADQMHSLDELIDLDGVKLIIDPKAVMFLIGSSLDYEETELQSGFVFSNPNEKGRCGCGDSFHV
jgi:iron-sulfur cluster assembly protein